MVVPRARPDNGGMDHTAVQEPPPPPPPPPPPLAAPRRLLRRPPPDGTIGGVCAGIADHLGVDVTLVRIAAVVLAFSGPGLPAYLVAWAVMPVAPPGTPYDPVRHGPVVGGGTTPVAGVALLLAAVLVVFDGGIFGRDVLVPALLIGAGAWLLVRDRDHPSADGTGSWQGVAGGAAVPRPGDPGDEVAPGQAVRPPTSSPTAPSAPAPARRPRSRLGTVVTGLLLLGAAALWALTAADVVHPDATDVLALGVLVIGAGLVVGAWYGRARWLVVPGFALVAALTVTSAVDVPLEGGFGERRYAPLAAGDVRDAYRLTAGRMVLDLRSLDPAGAPVPVVASIAAGSLSVLVPEGATIVVDTRIGVGQLLLPGEDRRERRDGAGVDEDVTLPGDEGAGTLVLDLEVGVGEVEVDRG